MKSLRFVLYSTFLFILLTGFTSSNPEGKPAPDLSFTDLSGNIVHLSDFKGKFVYLDLWATYCKPCLYEMEPSKRLMEEIVKEDGDNIEWVFVSLDQMKTNWKEYLDKENIGGHQLFAGRESINILKDRLDIYGIPFTLWIGSDGRIMRYNAPRPSEGIAKQLKLYIKKDMKRKRKKSRD